MADHHKLVILIGVIGKIWEDDDNMLDRFLFGRCHGELLSGNQPWLENPPFIEDSSIKTSIYEVFSIATFDYWRVSNIINRWFLMMLTLKDPIW